MGNTQQTVVESGGQTVAQLQEQLTALKKQLAAVKGGGAHKHRPYWAGVVVAEMGLETVAKTGVTTEMIHRVSTLTNPTKPNHRESEAWLKIAFNVASGYNDTPKK